MAITVQCSSCQAAFPVDPAKVPDEGVWARCSKCQGVFRVEHPGPAEAVPPFGGSAPSSPDAMAPALEAEAEPAAGPKFKGRDPKDRAARLARVLVSDIVLYNSARHEKSVEAGTVVEDFSDEVDKSWNEYVSQVGSEIAESTDYWREALNNILAKGEQLF